MSWLTDEIKEHIINFGSLSYNRKKMAVILDIDIKVIDSCMEDENSEFSKLYFKGKNMAEYIIDVELLKLARSGDIRAIEKIDQRNIAKKLDE